MSAARGVEAKVLSADVASLTLGHGASDIHSLEAHEVELDQESGALTVQAGETIRELKIVHRGHGVGESVTLRLPTRGRWEAQLDAHTLELAKELTPRELEAASQTAHTADGSSESSDESSDGSSDGASEASHEAGGLMRGQGGSSMRRVLLGRDGPGHSASAGGGGEGGGGAILVEAPGCAVHVLGEDWFASVMARSNF